MSLDYKRKVVTNMEDARKALDYLRGRKVIAVDTETSGLDWDQPGISICGICLGTDKLGLYFPIRMEHPADVSSNLPVDEFLPLVKELLESEDIVKVLHNWKFDAHFFLNDDIRFKGTVYDTLNMSKVLHVDRKSHRLKGLVDEYNLVPQAGDSEKEISDWRKNHAALNRRRGRKPDKLEDVSYSLIPLDLLGPYGCDDAVYTARLFKHYYAELQEASPELREIERKEMRVLEALFDMEREGARVSASYLAELKQDLIEKRGHICQEVYDDLGFHVNLKSSYDKRELMKLMDIDCRNRDGELSSDKSALNKAAKKYRSEKWLLKIVDFMEVDKLIGTYCEGIVARMVNGRVHCNFNNIVGTGRLCVDRDTEIHTALGLKRIVDVGLGDLVWTHKGNLKPVIGKYFKGYEPMYRITTTAGQIVCTAKHRVLIGDDWYHAGDLRPGQRVSSYGTHQSEALNPKDTAEGAGGRKALDSGREVVSETAGYPATGRRDGGQQFDPLGMEHFQGVLSPKVRTPHTGAKAPQPFPGDDGQLEGSAGRAGYYSSKGRVGEVGSSSYAHSGDSEVLQHNGVVREGEHGPLGAGARIRTAQGTEYTEYSLRGEAGSVQPRYFESAEALLERPARVLPGALCGVSAADGVGVVCEGPSSGSQCYARERAGTQKRHLLELKSSGDSTESLAATAEGRAHSSAPGGTLQRGLLLSGSQPVSRVGWGDSFNSISTAERQGQRKCDFGEGVRPRAYGQQEGTEGHVYSPVPSTTTITSIEPAGIREVWDIQVADDHSYLAGGVVNHNSCSNPNLQNIPGRSDDGKRVRKAFFTPDGYVITAVDFSQIELRVAAHMSGDEDLIKAYVNDEDLHVLSACKALYKDAEDVTALDRRCGKTLNFAILFGAGPDTLTEQLADNGYPSNRRKSRELIDNYMDGYPGLAKYIRQVTMQARRKGFVLNHYGRLRKLPGIHSTSIGARAHAERAAFSHVIQGTAADIMKTALIRVYDYFKENDLKSKVILTIHDELILYVHKDEVEAIREVIRLMEDFPEIRVPIKASLEYSAVSWGDKEEVEDVEAWIQKMKDQA